MHAWFLITQYRRCLSYLSFQSWLNIYHIFHERSKSSAVYSSSMRSSTFRFTVAGLPFQALHWWHILECSCRHSHMPRICIKLQEHRSFSIIDSRLAIPRIEIRLWGRSPSFRLRQTPADVTQTKTLDRCETINANAPRPGSRDRTIVQ